MSAHVTCQVEDRICTLRMTRVDKKNALTMAMYDALREGLEAAATNPEVRVVVIAGDATAFCSGNDLMDFANNPPSTGDSPVARFMRTLSTMEKPVIAAVNGVAVGIGTTMLLHCDLAYAGAGTKFSMPFVGLGICPEFASSYILPRLCGHVKAAELLMLGEAFTAEVAERCGIVNAVLPPAEVEATAYAKAAKMAALPPAALRTTKMLLKRWSGEQVTEAVRYEAEFFMPMLRGEEAREAIGAFLQKRKPDFSRFQ